MNISQQDISKIGKTLRQFKVDFDGFECRGYSKVLPDLIVYPLYLEKYHEFHDYYLIDVDFIQNLGGIRQAVEDELGGIDGFVPVRKPLVRFEATAPARSAEVYQKPKTWNSLRKYLTDKGGSRPYYFSLLARRAPDKPFYKEVKPKH